MTGGDRWSWGSPEHASAIRLAVLGVWLVIVAGSPYSEYARLPHPFIVGHGVSRVLLGPEPLKSFFFSYPVLMALKWAAVAGCAFAILRPNRWRWVMPAACACVVLLDMLTKATDGYANHAQLCPLFVLLVFGIFGGRRYLPVIGLRSSSSGPSRSAAVVWLASLMIIIPYTYISINRLREGGPALFLGDALLRDISYTSRWYAAYHFTIFLGLIGVPWVAAGLKLGFFATTLFELTSALTLFSRTFRLVWLAVIVSFHFITLFSMNIFFWENLVLVVVIFGWGVWRMDAVGRAWRAVAGCPDCPSPLSTEARRTLSVSYVPPWF